ncbi:MAG: YrbL family protein [Alphaproteobacteria bacterium]|nr:YrbL family protein [Alphaproteobacteria bacterium]
MPGDRLLAIDESKLIATGKWRNVYLHPEDETKVLKVYREDRTPADRRARHWYCRALPLSRFDANAKDIRQYRRVARKAPGMLDFICPLFGYAETTRGRALVAGHVRDTDGRTSETLRSYVLNNGLAKIAPALDGLFESLAAHHVTVEDPTAYNILVRQGGAGPELVIVDGLGDPTLIPYKTVSKRLNRRKLMRKKGKLLRKLHALVQES